MNELSAIVYVSSARELMDSHGLDLLLETSRDRNGVEGVTGLLLYCEGNFMQYIEGPSGPLQYVWGLIQGDRRHRDIYKLAAHPAPARMFEAWSMAFCHTHHAMFNRLMTAAWRARSEDRVDGIDGRALLLSFWHEQMALRSRID